MKKQATAMVMWVMIILVHAHLSFAAHQENSTTHSVCGGSVQDCLIANDLDSEFPDATSSHFRRVLAQVQSVTRGTSSANKPAINAPNSGYRGSSALSKNGRGGCRSQYDRTC